MSQSSSSRLRGFRRAQPPAGARAAVVTHPERIAVPGALRTAADWSWRFLVVAAAVVVLSYVVITFKTIVVAFILAILFAVVMEPLAAFLRNRVGINRSVAALLTILLALALVGGALGLAGRSIVSGFGGLAEQVRTGIDQGLVWLSEGPLAVDQAQIDQIVAEIQNRAQDSASAIAGGVLAATSTVGSFVTGALLAIFCIFFFLREGRAIWRWFVRLAPREARSRVNEAGIRAWVTLGSYVRTQALVALVDAVGIAVGAMILGVPFALPIGVLVFIGAFIPIVGALLSGAVAVVVALVDQGLVDAVIMLAIVLAVQQLEGNVLQPWLQANALSLHPIAVVLAVAAGGGLAGILGALLAVPIAAVLNTVVLYFTGYDKFPRLATDPDRPGGPPGEVEAAIDKSLAAIGEDELPEEDPDRARGAVREAELDVERARRRLAAARQALQTAEREGPDGQEPAPDRAEP